jgi:hypothetical protein
MHFASWRTKGHTMGGARTRADAHYGDATRYLRQINNSTFGGLNVWYPTQPVRNTLSRRGTETRALFELLHLI